MKFLVEYELPPARAIHTETLEAEDAGQAWVKCKKKHPRCHVRKINEADETNETDDVRSAAIEGMRQISNRGK